jgi:hypothetical protein
MNLRTVSFLIAAVALAAVTYARPELVISNDQRGLIYIGSFGFLPGGTLDMKLDGLKVTGRTMTTEVIQYGAPCFALIKILTCPSHDPNNVGRSI